VSASSNIISLAALREELAARFPAAAPVPERCWATGWDAIDQAAGGLPQHAVTELCGEPVSGALFLHRVLKAVQQKRTFAALVDGGRTFDPGSYDTAAFSRLLVAFCDTAEQGLKVADLLLRDGNLPLVLLDLQALPLRSLGRIPANTWHRFQRLVEKSGTVLVVMTPRPLVEAARLRIVLQTHWELADLKRPRHELMPLIGVQVFRRGKQVAPMEELRAQTA